jgi:FAD/FMN-containing dehydrogenase
MADALDQFVSSFAGSSSRAEAGVLFRPRQREEAARGIRFAHELGVALHATPRHGGVQLDLSSLTRTLEVDERSRLVHVEVGATLGTIQAQLETWGSSLMTAASPSLTVGEYLASGCAGARAVDDDPVSQAVAGLEAVALDGRLLRIRPAPRRAVGPDLIGAILASGWSLAIPLSAHLVVPARAPRARSSIRVAGRRGARARLDARARRPACAHAPARRRRRRAPLALARSGPAALADADHRHRGGAVTTRVGDGARAICRRRDHARLVAGARGVRVVAPWVCLRVVTQVSPRARSSSA